MQAHPQMKERIPEKSASSHEERLTEDRLLNIRHRLPAIEEYQKSRFYPDGRINYRPIFPLIPKKTFDAEYPAILQPTLFPVFPKG